MHASHILDSGPAPEFDAVVAHVRDLFDLPICLITLLDSDRQWFKARCGVDIDGTDRNLAFCNYTLVVDDVFVIEDAATDPLFHNHPLVTGPPHVRFYAGAPLRLAPGIALGTLCVASPHPRKLTPAERLVLERLATVVTGLIRGHGMAHDASRLAQAAEAQSRIVLDQARDLRIRERRFLQTERIAGVGGFERDLATGAVAWSDETYRIYDLPIGTPIDLGVIRSVFDPEDYGRLEGAMNRALADGKGFDVEIAMRTASGLHKWVRVAGEVEIYEGRPRRFFGTFQDVSERRQTDARLWQAANCDALTALANRSCFDATLEKASLDPAGAPGMLMVDADYLKDVNDTLGHAAGDALLRSLARRLEAAVGPAGLVARIGGDEFAVLVKPPVTAQALGALGAAILACVRAPLTFEDRTMRPSVSIGGAFGDVGESLESLRQKADLALYHAKTAARGGYVAFHGGLRAAIDARRAAVGTVDEALARGDVLAWYQPVVDLTSGTISALEALARVRLGDTITSIADFPDALRDRRTATRITACMLDHIVRDVAAWRAAGITVPRIGLNVGPLDFQEGAIEAMVLETCERAGLAMSQFALEVTEAVFLSREATLVAETAARMRQRGVIVALDDFGTGHASLAHLATFPIDVIKLDSSFVRQIDHGGAGAIIAAAVIDLAQKLGLQIVAEGVEDHAQLARLVGLGCKKAQGFHFARALRTDDMARFLQAMRSPPASAVVGPRRPGTWRPSPVLSAA